MFAGKIEEELTRAVEMLRKGKVILYPTDTIWGIGCDATQAKAVQKVFKIKGRPAEKSAIILLDSVERLSDYVKEVPSATQDFYEQAPGPLTIVFEQGKSLPKSVLAKDGTIAIRVVRNEFVKEMIRRLGKPVISTSANLSGEPAPIMYSEISNDIKEKVDYIVDYDRYKIHSTAPSTIIKLELNNAFTVLRE